METRGKILRKDLTEMLDHPMGTAMAIQRLAREVAELREINTALVCAARAVSGLCAPLSRLTAGNDEKWEMAIRELRDAVAKADGE